MWLWLLDSQADIDELVSDEEENGIEVEDDSAALRDQIANEDQSSGKGKVKTNGDDHDANNGSEADEDDDDEEEEDVDLLYDSALNCYYDPKTGTYYELNLS